MSRSGLCMGERTADERVWARDSGRTDPMSASVLGFGHLDGGVGE